MDEDEYLRARDALLDRFRDVASADDAWVAEQLLHFKYNYLDGPLTRWAAEDLSQILLGLFPAKVMLESDELDDVVPCARTFIVWLHDEGLLSASSDPLPVLRATLNAVAAEFPEAMGDSSRFGMAKSMTSGMVAGGVDLQDADAVQAWIDAHNALPFEERVAATGGPAGFSGAPPLPTLPPFAPPSDEEIAVAVEESVFLRRARAFVEYLGEGLALTQKGNLKLADGRALVELLDTGDVLEEHYGGKVHRVRSTEQLRNLDFIFHWLRAAGLTKVRKGRVEPTKAAAQLRRDPVAAWDRGLDGLLKLGPLGRFYARSDFAPPWLEQIDASLPAMLFALAEHDETVEIDAMVESQWEWICQEWPVEQLDDLHYDITRGITETGLRRVLDQLAELGVVAVEDVVEELDDLGFPDRSEGTVQLTQLGRAAIHQIASEYGVVAPAAGRLREAGAGELLETLTGAPPQEVDAEVRVWLAQRQPAVAAAEIRAALEAGGRADDVAQLLRISVAMAIWDQIGAAGADAVRALCDHPVAGPFAAAWLEVQQLPGPPPNPGALLVGLAVMSPEDAIVDLAGMPSDQQVALMEMARAERWPGTEALLTLVAGAHPDKVVAKAARRLLFRLRSGGRR